MEQLQNIEKKLFDLGYEHEKMKPFLLSYLEQIEKIFRMKEESRLSATNLLKKDISISEIAREINCSRATLYNHNHLLKKYIIYSIERLKKDNPFTLVKLLEEKNKDLKYQNQLMIIRDINYEQLKQQNIVLQKELKEKDQEIFRLQGHLLSLSGKL